ncbi:MAG TPA: thioredoxin domain-containing protein [Galbitalea sp.]
MPNRLADAVSPYLRSHADNPVDWFPWGADAFAEAVRRDVPVLVSIGYATCRWCHVMARESFSDPALAEYLNANFVSIKVDREEHPDVDSSYLAAAGAFTDQLGWPLTVFATPTGRAFFAGTYFPPVAIEDRASFRQVLGAVLEAWQTHRNEVETSAATLAEALARPTVASAGPLPTATDFDAVVSELVQYEDTEYGGFGGAPKFPVATVIGFLLDREDAGDAAAGSLARRTLAVMAASDLRDPVEGGFFRYATRRDWSEPHYERMLYDNALLLACYARVGDEATAAGIAGFLLDVLRVPDGAFASAQDSESTVDGERVEGGYYALGRDERARQTPPALDEKVLTGWNGLAIGALASAGSLLGHPEWIAAAVRAAEVVGFGEVVRARIGERISDALPTLEDFGMLADGLLDLAVATGESRYAVRARELVEACVSDDGFAVAGGADPVLEAHGLALDQDPSEGAYPSGLSAIARAAVRLERLGAVSGDSSSAAIATMERVAPLALPRPVSFGASLGVMSLLASPERQLVVVTPEQDGPLALVARGWRGGTVAVVSDGQATAFADAGFELFEARGSQGGRATAYLCEHFVCQLPVTDAADLAALL